MPSRSKRLLRRRTVLLSSTIQVSLSNPATRILLLAFADARDALQRIA